MKNTQTISRLIALLTIVTIVAGFLPQIKTQAACDYSSVFAASYYSSHYADLKAAGITTDQQLLNHFINYGMKEGRQGSAEFNVYAYMNRYADLKAKFGNNLESYYMHYINYGKAEGRNGKADGTTAATVTVIPAASSASSEVSSVKMIRNDADYEYNQITWYTDPETVTKSGVTGHTDYMVYPSALRATSDFHWDGTGRKYHTKPVAGLWGIAQFDHYYTDEEMYAIAQDSRTAQEQRWQELVNAGMVSSSTSTTTAYHGTIHVGDIWTTYYHYELVKTRKGKDGKYENYNTHTVSKECYAIAIDGTPLFREIGGNGYDVTAVKNLMAFYDPSMTYMDVYEAIARNVKALGQSADCSSQSAQITPALWLGFEVYYVHNKGYAYHRDAFGWLPDDYVSPSGMTFTHPIYGFVNGTGPRSLDILINSKYYHFDNGNYCLSNEGATPRADVVVTVN